MFDFQPQIRLRQAQHALGDGRLDEAFQIASEKEIRELRGGQILLESLVEPLLDRAETHFEAGRMREAQLDVEKAVVAGGNRTRTAALRGKVREAIESQELAARRQRELIESAQAHVHRGSFRTGLELAATIAEDTPEAARLRREVESRERKAGAAQARASLHLERGEVVEAIAAAREAFEAAPRDASLVELRGKVKDAALAAARAALDTGDLPAACELLGRLEPLAGESLDVRRLGQALRLATDAAAALERHRYEEARLHLVRLAKDHPEVAWIETSLRDVTRIVEALPALWASPLGKARTAERERGEETRPRMGTMLKDDAPFSQPRRAGAVSPTTDQALHLWVDGIGTYLLFLGDKIGIGRSGSSTRPQLALAADIAGYHAEIVRTGDDYFLVAAQGSVQVGGKHVRRKLLADGEVIDLGAGCRMTFKLPTAMSSTAVLSFHRGLRLEGDVRQILLVKDNLILGPGSNCHVKTQTQGENIVLSMGQEGIACRAGEEILVDGQPAGLETAVRLGSHLQIGDLTLTITGSAQGILPQLPARDGGAGFPA